MYINLETKRLRIRAIGESDARFMLDLVNSEGWLKFIGNRNISNINEAKDYIQKILDTPDYYYSIFELKNSGKAIGIVTFLKREYHDFPDIGFALLPKFEKNGYTIEACKAYLNEVLKTSRYKNIIAITIPHNQKSINLLAKLGLNYQYDFNRNSEILSLFSLNDLV